MKLLQAIFALCKAESLISGREMAPCGLKDDLCLKSSRTPGTLVCAELTPESLDNNLGAWYDPGYEESLQKILKTYFYLKPEVLPVSTRDLAHVM